MLTIVVVAVYSYYSARRAIMVRTFEQLTSVRVEKCNSVERFFNDRIRDVEMVSASEAIAGMYDTHENTDNIDRNRVRESSFASYLNSYLRSSGYYKKIILVAKDGSAKTVDLRFPNPDIHFLYGIDSTSDEAVTGLIGRIRATGKTCFQDYTVDKESEATLFVGTPIGAQGNGQNTGVVILEIAVQSINEMMYENNPQNGLGNSGEAYIVGSDYLIRTASRFQDHSIFRTKVETEGVNKALKGQTGVEIIRDYRGVSVLSSFSKIQIPDLNWVILAEIDQAEAMIPVYNLRNDIVLLACIISLLMLGVVYLISRRMTLPVIRLKQATDRISEGEYHLQLNVTSQDELGALTEAFNHMAKKLESQSEQINDARLKRLSSMIDGQEIERQRLSRDLHDSLGQSILAVKMKLEQARQNDSEKSRKSLLEALDLIRIVIQEIRAITHDLMPPVLAAFGVEKGLNNLCKETSSGTGIDLHFESAGIPDTLNSRTQIYLYRIAQEAVHNITKHARATKASVKLSCDAENLYLQVADNGVGFDIADPDIRANGISNMLERAELLGGKCIFTSRKGEGTIIDVKIPIG